MSSSQPATKRLDASDPAGLTLRVEFVWRGDRFGHVLWVVEPNGQLHPVLESIEGTAADDWPPSPPLQSLSLEEIAPGRRAALLVGMAGRSHWSASVEAIPGQAALAFDIACRPGPQLSTTEKGPGVFGANRPNNTPDKLPPKTSDALALDWQLHSQYQVLAGCELIHHGVDDAALSSIEIRLRCAAAVPVRVVLATEAATAHSDRIVILPIDVASQGATIRWRYRLGLTA